MTKAVAAHTTTPTLRAASAARAGALLAVDAARWAPEPAQASFRISLALGRDLATAVEALAEAGPAPIAIDSLPDETAWWCPAEREMNGLLNGAWAVSGPAGCARVLGQRWTGVVLGNLSTGPAGFRELARSIDGISDSMLSTRLAALTAARLLTRTVDEGPPLSVAYALTDAGHALMPALSQISRWAEEHLPDPALATTA